MPEKTKRSLLSGLPPVLSNIESSVHLRTAFVEHTVSEIITRRIFAPFLFVLSGRLRPADALFFGMSQELKRKSIKREAVWRQRTLHAAFTASSAKQSINDIAIHVIDEIVNAIKDLADRNRWTHITAAVRRIVKTAAETWRYARVESFLVTASMDGNDIVQGSGARAGGSIGTLDPGKKGLLLLFPIIKREAAFGAYEDGFKQLDQGFIYSTGRVLYSDGSVLPTYEADTQPKRGRTHPSPPSTDAHDRRQPIATQTLRPQSPLVPEKPPLTSSPQEHHQWETPRWDANPEQEDASRHNEDRQALLQDLDPTIDPIEQEATNSSSHTKSRHASMATTASDESAGPAGKVISIQDPHPDERGSSRTESQ